MKKLNLSALILITGLLLSSCSSVRIKYQATIVDDYFKTAQFEYYKSYPLEDLRRKCMLTAIFFGGACWGYLKEPSDELKKKVSREAHLMIEEIFGPNNFGHRNIEVTRFGWNDLPEDYDFPSGSPLRNNYQFYHQEPEQRYPSPLTSPRYEGLGEGYRQQDSQN